MLPSRSFSRRRRFLSRPLTFESLECRSLLDASGLDCGVQSAEVPQAAPRESQPAAVASANAAPRAARLTANDSYENNDTLGTASNLGTLSAARTISSLNMNDPADWFKFTMSAAGTSSDYVRIAFTHTRGDLDLELYSSSGRLLARSQGVTNTEQVALRGLAAGTYYVRAYGYRGVQNPSYSLTIDPGAAAAVTAPTTTTTTTTTSTSTTGPFNIQIRYTGLTSTEQAIFEQAAVQWERLITGDLPNASYNGLTVDDVLIDASSSAIDGTGGTLGQAGPDRFRSGTMLPYHGSMQFDSADLAQMRSEGTLQSVIEHEIGHILGIGTLWSLRGLLSGAGTSNPRFTGPRATAEYNTLFGRSETGVPVEAGGGAGTRDVHWRDSVFSNELMTGWAGPGTNLPLSRITAASLVDLGYQVSMSLADPYSRPSTTTTSTTSGAVTSGSGVIALEADLQRSRQQIDEVMTLWNEA